jgi:hypothetical protein
MSPIAIGLDGLLILLLLITLMVGLRLNGRLKGLRADHASFAKAVSELDAALLRAEGGLKELRTATAEAQTVLAGRVQDARSAAARLDELIAKAALASVPAPAPIAPAPREAAPLELLRPRPAPEPAAEPVRLDARRELRSRARVDEDLFAAEDTDSFPRLRFGGAAR